MHYLFKENLANGKHQAHGEHKLAVRKRLGNPSVIVPLIIVFIVLWLGIPLTHSTEESSRTATNDKVSSGITPSVVENKIEEMKERIKASEAVEPGFFCDYS